jgi:ParB family chromosome partitioning protein
MKEPFTKLFGFTERESERVIHISPQEIHPSPFQPRLTFDDERLDELCQTIKNHGVIQPIVVRKVEQGYELVAGERRWRAVQKLQLSTIPAIVREMDHESAASIALIENLQREGLNALEEAFAYQKLIELQSLTQEELALRLGKSQSTIANKLRLLQLPEKVQEALFQRLISERHARALLMLKEAEKQEAMLQEMIANKWSVKQTEERVKKEQHSSPKSSTKQKKRRRNLSRDMRIALNTIRQSVQMVQEAGMTVEMTEQISNQDIELTIRISGIAE